MLYVSSTDRNSRIQIIKIHTKKKPLNGDVKIEELAGHTDGYTGADIASLSSAAVMLALREHISKYQDPKEADKHTQELRIHMRHFEEAMKFARRSVTDNDIRKYEMFAQNLRQSLGFGSNFKFPEGGVGGSSGTDGSSSGNAMEVTNPGGGFGQEAVDDLYE